MILFLKNYDEFLLFYNFLFEKNLEKKNFPQKNHPSLLQITLFYF
jgi:hypothetical protein